MGGDQELVDDLARVLARTVTGWVDVIGVDLAEHPEVVRVMARYRESKAASTNSTTELTRQHLEDTVEP
jgi:hypothetical protein